MPKSLGFLWKLGTSFVNLEMIKSKIDELFNLPVQVGTHDY